ncbi:MAG TPA: D-2-hydroxyacid dehydrogenase [Candidatus Paceibacterota bacterium]|nr:D-2-hydroxyacid dehydrogenase [Candidatus Paceibacterota bacterium]
MIQVVLHPRHDPGVEAVLEAISGIELVRPTDDQGVVAALAAGGEVLVTYTWQREFLSPSLRWIAGTGVGFDQYPLAELADGDVALTTAYGIHSGCVAEHAFGLLMACTRAIGESARNQSRGVWRPIIGEEVSGRRMLIVGLGQIGEAIARRAVGWEMEIVGIKRSPERYDGILSDVRSPEALQEMCAWAEILVLSIPAGSETKHLIGAKELDLLGSGWVVNVARGSVIDEKALLERLQDGRLRGAGLDVFESEPLPHDSPLWTLPNVVMTAHNAASSPRFGSRWGDIFRANLSALSSGGTWRNRLGQDGRFV